MQRPEVYQAHRTLFKNYDFLALPSVQVFPFDAGQNWPTEIEGVVMDGYQHWMEIVAGPRLSGCPTVAVPAGFGPGGLPSGIQPVGRAGKTLAVLQLAHAYEEVSTPVIDRLPTLLWGA